MADHVSKTTSPSSPAAVAHHRPLLEEESGEKDRRHPWVWVVVILVILGIALLAYFRHQKPPPKPPPPVAVSTTNAVSGSVDNTVSGLGTVTPIYTVAVSTRVDGQIESVDYKEGQLVNTNDLLVQIDPRPYQAALNQSQGQLAHDRATLAKDRNDLQRYQLAYQKNAIPKMTYDDQVETVHQDEGTVKSDEGVVSNAEVNLSYCTIRAPFAGRVGLRLIDPGNVVHAANTNALVVVTKLQPITVEFTVAENYLPQIEEQTQLGHEMTVEAWTPDWSRKIAEGRFLTTDNLVDVSTGTIRIKAIFPNENLALFPNYFVNAKLIINTLQNVTLVPTVAIQRNPQGAFVYEVDSDSKIKMQNVTPGLAQNDMTQVDGLGSGAEIVTDNFNKLSDKMKVVVRKPGEKGTPRGGENDQGTNGPAQGAKGKKHHKKDQSDSGKGQDSAS